MMNVYYMLYKPIQDFKRVIVLEIAPDSRNLQS